MQTDREKMIESFINGGGVLFIEYPSEAECIAGDLIYERIPFKVEYTDSHAIITDLRDDGR